MEVFKKYILNLSNDSTITPHLAVLFLHLPDRFCQLATFLLQFCLMLIAATTTTVN